MERDIHELLKISQENKLIFTEIKDMMEILLKSQDEKMFFEHRKLLCRECLYRSKIYSSNKYIKQYKNMSKDQQRQEDHEKEYIFNHCLTCNPYYKDNSNDSDTSSN
jgi:hypothetical protein